MLRPYWPFNINSKSWEAQGLVFWAPVVPGPGGLGDLVGGGRGTMTATFTGYWDMPIFGPCIRFGVSSTGQRLNIKNRRPVQFGPITARGTPMTLSCWALKEQEPATTQWLFGAGAAASSTSILIDSSQRLNFIGPYVSNQLLVVSTDTVNVGQLYHFAATWDGTATAANSHLYINGVECSYTTQQNGTIPVGFAGDVFVGNIGTATLPWLGPITDVRFYNYQMTTAQVNELRQRVTAWDLYDASRPVVFDVTAASTFLSRLAVMGAG